MPELDLTHLIGLLSRSITITVAYLRYMLVLVSKKALGLLSSSIAIACDAIALIPSQPSSRFSGRSASTNGGSFARVRLNLRFSANYRTRNIECEHRKPSLPPSKRSLAGWFRRRHPWPPCLRQPITLTRCARSPLALLADTSLSRVTLSLGSPESTVKPVSRAASSKECNIHSPARRTSFAHSVISLSIGNTALFSQSKRPDPFERSDGFDTPSCARESYS